MKNLIFFIFIALTALTACSKRAQCPAYMPPSQGTISAQDAKGMTPEEIQKQSKKLLDTQDSYSVVVRDKKTGLVKSKKLIKKGKNNTRTHKGMKIDPRSMQGIK